MPRLACEIVAKSVRRIGRRNSVNQFCRNSIHPTQNRRCIIRQMQRSQLLAHLRQGKVDVLRLLIRRWLKRKDMVVAAAERMYPISSPKKQQDKSIVYLTIRLH